MGNARVRIFGPCRIGVVAVHLQDSTGLTEMAREGFDEASYRFYLHKRTRKVQKSCTTLKIEGYRKDRVTFVWPKTERVGEAAKKGRSDLRSSVMKGPVAGVLRQPALALRA